MTSPARGDGASPRVATLGEALREDVRLSHALRHPGRRPTCWTVARALLTSRGLLLLAEHRIALALARWRPGGPAGRILLAARHVLSTLLGYLTSILTKSDLRLGTALEEGVYLSARGRIFLGARFVGAGTVIHDRVSIGRSPVGEGTPEIGRRVWIGPDTVIVGDITVGDGATILAHTVVTRSVPPGAVVQGNPAHLVRRDYDNALLRSTAADDVEQLFTAPPGGGGARMLDVVPHDLRHHIAHLDPPASTRSGWALLAFGPQALLAYRLGRWTRAAPHHPARWLPALLLSPAYLLLAAWVRLAYDIRLELSADIGPGLTIFHFNGIRLRRCRLGAHCVIHQEVRVEPAEEGGPGPQIGDRVWIGPHARIVGAIRVGDGATVAAGALVTRDVDAGSLVVGRPARTTLARYDNRALL